MFRNGSGNYVPDDCDAKTLAEKSEAARLSFAGRLEPTKKAGLLLCVHGAGRRVLSTLAACDGIRESAAMLLRWTGGR